MSSAESGDPEIMLCIKMQSTPADQAILQKCGVGNSSIFRDDNEKCKRALKPRNSLKHLMATGKEVKIIWPIVQKTLDKATDVLVAVLSAAFMSDVTLK